MFAYCGNNPVSRTDSSGEAWETALDVVSLLWSIAEVAANPTDFWAWASMSGDLVDVMIPFVGGIGETVKALSTLNKASEAAEAASDFSKGLKQINDVLDNAKDTTKFKGPLRNYENPGTIYDAFLDFLSLNPSDVRTISTPRYGTGLVGMIDTTKVVLRNGSTTGGATLEIVISTLDTIKIRYIG